MPPCLRALRTVIIAASCKMAFLNKFGAILKQSNSTSNVTNGQFSMLNAVRCMSSKLFVGGLSYGTDDQSLKDYFTCFGDVTDAKVITDRDSGRSRGFGFVNFSSDDSAAAMDGKELHIRVSYAQERVPRSSYSRGGGGFRGGYGNSGENDGF